MSKPNFKKLRLRQVSKMISEKKPIQIEEIGKQLKNIRESLGMTQQQLAKKLKVSQSAISQLEENIAASKLTTVIKMAQALNCDFMGVIVSHKSLEKMVKEQAEKTAKRILDRTYANMAMEKQRPSARSYKEQLIELSRNLLNEPGPELWGKA